MPLVSQQILRDRYQLQEPLGRNFVRQTWTAIDLTTQTTVILKFLPFGGAVQWDDLKLFEREVQVLRQLNHPQIPRYQDSFSIDDQFLWFCLVESYIPGRSLKQLLDDGKRFSETDVVQLATAVLQILLYLHELNPPVIHRDIKPSNLIWGDDQQIYLVDFGAVQDKAAATGRTMTVAGTYGYAPLEQFSGQAVAASDLYGLGATLIHMMTGIAPSELPQRNARIMFRDRVSNTTPLVQWVERLTEPAVEKRYPTARAALMALVERDRLLLPHRSPSRVSGALTAPPPYTSILLNRNSNRDSLEILIPSRHITINPILDLFGTPDEPGRISMGQIALISGFIVAGFLVSVPGFLPVVVLLWIIGACGVALVMSWLNGLEIALSSLPINVEFTRQTAQLRIRDSPYPLQGNHTIKISEIRRVYTVGNNPKKMAVALETPHGVISIGLTALTGEGNNKAPRITQILSSAEATWLADEIRAWLAETPTP